MNPAFDQILEADDATRLGLFTTTAQRLGTTPQNAEKDFWVCWTLDALFNGLPPTGPRLLFKGGTSLSKGFGLIERFSEDIDVTVFRDDLGEPVSIEDLQRLSGKKREASLAAIKLACEAFINGPMLEGLDKLIAAAAKRTGLPRGRFAVRRDDDSQTLLLEYPSATPGDDYIAKAVKIESGAKSALDPHAVRTIRPYADDDAPGLELTVPNVTIVDAERTFWDKVVILHGLRRWFDLRGELKGNGQRVSRHYYDIHMLMASEAGRNAIADRALGEDCVAHARMFFNRAPFDLGSAHPPTFALCPEGEMTDDLRRDYQAMSVMIFGTAPAFDKVIESAADLQQMLNAPTGKADASPQGGGT